MSARSPLLGLRRLTSAITLEPAARKCGIGSRGGSTSASAARRSASAGGGLALRRGRSARRRRCRRARTWVLHRVGAGWLRDKPLTPRWRRAGGPCGAQGASQARRQVAGDGERRRPATPSATHTARGDGERRRAPRPPRQQATSRRPHRATTTGSASTSSRLLDAAAAEVEVGQVVDRAQAAAARAAEPEQRVGQKPQEPAACGSRRCSASVPSAASRAAASGGASRGGDRARPARRRRGGEGHGIPRQSGQSVEAHLGHHREDDERARRRGRRRPRRSSCSPGRDMSPTPPTTKPSIATATAVQAAGVLPWLSDMQGSSWAWDVGRASACGAQSIQPVRRSGRGPRPWRATGRGSTGPPGSTARRGVPAPGASYRLPISGQPGDQPDRERRWRPARARRRRPPPRTSRCGRTLGVGDADARRSRRAARRATDDQPTTTRSTSAPTRGQRAEHGDRAAYPAAGDQHDAPAGQHDQRQRAGQPASVAGVRRDAEASSRRRPARRAAAHGLVAGDRASDGRPRARAGRRGRSCGGPQAAALSHRRASSTSASKQVRSPVWQAGALLVDPHAAGCRRRSRGGPP